MTYREAIVRLSQTPYDVAVYRDEIRILDKNLLIVRRIPFVGTFEEAITKGLQEILNGRTH